MVELKRNLLWRGFLRHGLVLLLAAWMALAIFSPVPMRSARASAIVVALTGVHLMADWGKNVWGRRSGTAEPKAFLADQLCHLLAIAVAAPILAGSSWDTVATALSPHALSPKTAPVLAIYVGVIFGGGPLVRNLTKPLLDELTEFDRERTESVRRLRNAGLYIGWLERFLVLSALVLQSPATVGLILTAKSIIRFPELKDLRFAEYFLIGTLLSVSIALAGGMGLAAILYGTLSLK